MVDTRYDYCIGTANKKIKKNLTAMLIEAGYYSSGDGNSVPVLLRRLRTVQPWLVIVDTALPPGNIEELAEIIESDGLAASIFINTTGVRLDSYVQLSWPIEAPVLQAVANAVCREFARKKKMQKEIESLQAKINQRKIIERAKGTLTKLYSINEDEAYHFIRQSSMEERMTMVEMSRLIIREPERFSSLLRHR